MIQLPWRLQRRLEASARELLTVSDMGAFDFSRPRGEAALVGADSVAWHVFKNPIALLVGGLAAVILELAEPAVRAAIWDHSSFRRDPMQRMRRTGVAALATVYGARSLVEPMIARVTRLHRGITGTMESGRAYAASDPRLLSWVQATAAFGFAEAYHRYVAPLNREQLDRFYREGRPASILYGALGAPDSVIGQQRFFAAMLPQLEASPVVFEFLRIMHALPGYPRPLNWLQGSLVRAAVEIIPAPLRARLGLTAQFGLRSGERWLVSGVAAAANRICLLQSPPALACVRLGLSARVLYS